MTINVEVVNITSTNIEVRENGTGSRADRVRWTDLRKIQKYHSRTLILLLDQWGMGE